MKKMMFQLLMLTLCAFSASSIVKASCMPYGPEARVVAFYYLDFAVYLYGENYDHIDADEDSSLKADKATLSTPVNRICITYPHGYKMVANSYQVPRDFNDYVHVEEKNGVFNVTIQNPSDGETLIMTNHRISEDNSDAELYYKKSSSDDATYESKNGRGLMSVVHGVLSTKTTSTESKLYQVK